MSEVAYRPRWPRCNATHGGHVVVVLLALRCNAATGCSGCSVLFWLLATVLAMQVAGVGVAGVGFGAGEAVAVVGDPAVEGSP